MTSISRAWDILRLIRHGGPALCNVAVTNACNAACDFCNFARGKVGTHTRLADMISMVVAKGMGPALITNGWLLPAQLDRLAATGLKTVYVSIDAAAMSVHEANRGLKGLEKRIRLATAHVHELKMTPLAQITMSKLITD